MKKKLLTPTPPKGPRVDLLAITRGSTLLRTSVVLFEEREPDGRLDWLVFGEGHIRPRSSSQEEWALFSYLKEGVTDFEHDSAYALSLILVGVQLKEVSYHRTHLVGWIGGRADDFRVPRPGYNPMEHPDAVKCLDKACKGPDRHHIIVPEGFYVPPKNEALFNKVRGLKVEVSFSVLR